MADAARAVQLSQELTLLQSCQTALESNDKVLQTAARRGGPTLAQNQFETIRMVFSLIPKTCPIIVPDVNDVALLSTNLAAARIIVATRIAAVRAILSPPRAEPASEMSPPSTSHTTQRVEGTERQPKPTFKLFGHAFAVQGDFFQLIGTLFSLVTLGVAGNAFYDSVLNRPSRTPVLPGYEAQLKSLDRTKEAIQSVLGFIEDQQKQLQLSKSAVDALKNEEGRIHPLVEADRKVIDALFAVQEQRNQAQQSRERLMGFLFGVGASLVASIVYSFVFRIIQRRRSG